MGRAGVHRAGMFPYRQIDSVKTKVPVFNAQDFTRYCRGSGFTTLSNHVYTLQDTADERK